MASLVVRGIVDRKVGVNAQRQRGSILLQFALVVPILIVVALMAWEVWQVVAIKKAVHMAAYHGARYIASNPKMLQLDPSQVKDNAAQLVMDNLSRNTLTAEHLEDLSIDISELGGAWWNRSKALACGDEFRLSVSIPWRVEMPFLDRVWQGDISSHYEDRLRCRE